MKIVTSSSSSDWKKPERKLVLRIIDNQSLITEERSMDSFLCGFHLALKMANELNYYKQRSAENFFA